MTSQTPRTNTRTINKFYFEWWQKEVKLLKDKAISKNGSTMVIPFKHLIARFKKECCLSTDTDRSIQTRLGMFLRNVVPYGFPVKGRVQGKRVYILPDTKTLNQWIKQCQKTL